MSRSFGGYNDDHAWMVSWPRGNADGRCGSGIPPEDLRRFSSARGYVAADSSRIVPSAFALTSRIWVKGFYVVDAVLSIRHWQDIISSDIFRQMTPLRYPGSRRHHQIPDGWPLHQLSEMSKNTFSSSDCQRQRIRLESPSSRRRERFTRHHWW